jgi:hypothetical protein
MSQKNSNHLDEHLRQKLEFGPGKESRTDDSPQSSESIAQTSSLGEFFRDVDWKNTLILNFERAFLASLVWAIVLFFITKAGGVGSEWETFIYFLVALPFSFTLLYIPLGVVYSYITRNKTSESNIGCIITWMFVVAPTLMIIVGDPILFLLHRIKPSLVPVDKYRFIEFSLAIFVRK